MRTSTFMRTGLLACIASFAAATPALADITVGGFTFQDNAFVDALTNSSGNYATSGGGSLSGVLTDLSEDTFAFSFDQGAFVDLAFTNNVAVNGSGTDIVLFELGIPDAWTVTINGVTLGVGSSGTGASAGGFALNAGLIDLSDFGIGAGGTVSSLRLAFIEAPGGTVASTSLVGALNSRGAVPEPASWAMMISGFALTGAAARRRATPALTA